YERRESSAREAKRLRRLQQQQRQHQQQHPVEQQHRRHTRQHDEFSRRRWPNQRNEVATSFLQEAQSLPTGFVLFGAFLWPTRIAYNSRRFVRAQLTPPDCFGVVVPREQKDWPVRNLLQAWCGWHG